MIVVKRMGCDSGGEDGGVIVVERMEGMEV